MLKQVYTRCKSRNSDQACPKTKTRLHLRNLLIQAITGLVGRLVPSGAASQGVEPKEEKEEETKTDQWTVSTRFLTRKMTLRKHKIVNNKQICKAKRPRQQTSLV